MTGDLGFLPGSELGIQFFQRKRRFPLEPIDFLADGDGTTGIAHEIRLTSF